MLLACYCASCVLLCCSRAAKGLWQQWLGVGEQSKGTHPLSHATPFLQHIIRYKPAHGENNSPAAERGKSDPFPNHLPNPTTSAAEEARRTHTSILLVVRQSRLPNMTWAPWQLKQLGQHLTRRHSSWSHPTSVPTHWQQLQEPKMGMNMALKAHTKA